MMSLISWAAIENTITWTNENSGFLTLVLFVATLIIGWISGLFKAMRRRPVLDIEVKRGPTFCASFDTGRVYNGYQTHRTALALYLSITNTGNAPTDIKEIHVGYKSQMYKLPFRWFWLKELTVCKSDFVASLGRDDKVFPFLIQKNQLTNNVAETYLLEGKSCSGIVYFEQEESFGAAVPKTTNHKLKVKIRIYDVFGNSYSTKAVINKVTLQAARDVCEKFGTTRESLTEPEPKEPDTAR